MESRPAMVLMEPGIPDRPRAPPGIWAELLGTVTPALPRPRPSPRPRAEAAELGTEDTGGWAFGVAGAGVLELGRDGVVEEVGSVGWLGGLGVLLEGTGMGVVGVLVCGCCGCCGGCCCGCSGGCWDWDWTGCCCTTVLKLPRRPPPPLDTAVGPPPTTVAMDTEEGVEPEDEEDEEEKDKCDGFPFFTGD